MMCGMKLRSERPEPEGLGLKDFENVRHRYPQKPYGELGWVVACGAASKFMLDADEIKERETRNHEIRDARKHKDLEIYLFGEEGLKGSSRYPLEIFGVDFWGPLHELDYSEAHAPNHWFYVEALKEYYYGFRLPSSDDIVTLKMDNKRILSLSPEFIVASKLFHTRGVRKGVDDTDALNLMKKFHLDREYLLQLVADSKFAFVGSDVIANLERLLESGELFSTLSKMIRKRYSKSRLDIGKMGYNSLASLLDYSPKSLGVDELKEMYITGVIAKPPLQEDVAQQTELALTYALQHLPAPAYSDEAYMLAKGVVYRSLSDPHGTIGVTSEMNRVLTKLDKTMGNLGLPQELRDDISLKIAKSIIGSLYANVKLARYSTEIEKMSQANNLDKEFSSFIKNLMNTGWIK